MKVTCCRYFVCHIRKQNYSRIVGNDKVKDLPQFLNIYFNLQLTSFTYYNLNSSGWNTFDLAGTGKLGIKYYDAFFKNYMIIVLKYTSCLIFTTYFINSRFTRL